MNEGRFGKYYLLRKIAAGGMGEVFLARQQGPEGFEKILVIKRILSHHTDNRDYVDMFFAEARLAAKMSHSNIVQIYEMGEIDESYYIAMEFVNGKSIKDIIDASRAKGIPIPPAHTADIVAKLCAGLGYAHALTDMSGGNLNIIHRDVNPHNVLVTYGGEAKIIDFGIAKSEMNEHKTETGTIKGKFVYMSPEQSAAEKIDKRSDIFSIGIVLYEMLSGDNPFQKANIVLSLDAIQRFHPPLPSTIDPEFLAFDPIMERALAKNPNERYQDCSEMQLDLQRAIMLGEVRKPETSLAKFMHELFQDQIDKENKFIQETGRGMAVQQGGMTGTRTKPPSGAYQVDEFAEPHLTPRPTPLPIHQTGSRSGSAIIRRKKRRLAVSIVSVILVAAAVSVVFIIMNSPKQQQQTVQVLMPVEPHAAVQPQPQPAVAQQIAPPQPVVAQQMSPPQPVVAQQLPAQQLPPQQMPQQALPPPQQKTPVLTARDKKLAAHDKGHKEQEKAPAPTPAPQQQIVIMTPPAAAKVEPPKPEPVSIVATPQAQSGYFLVNSNPQASIFRDGHSLGNAAPMRVDVKSPVGAIKIGDAGSPFQLTFHYRITGPGAIEIAVDSEPWAIMKKNGVGIGKTPRPGMSGDTRPMRFEFVNPAVTGGMSVVLRFFPG